MQKASGADIRDLTRSARLSASNSSASVIRSAFPFPVHSCRTQRYSLPVRAGGSHGRTSRVRVSENISCPVGRAPAIRGIVVAVMQNGYACVCHSRFQNEVMDG
jgi:hypothetical protein